MQYYDRIDVFVGIDFSKISKSKECDIVTIGIFCNYGNNIVGVFAGWYFTWKLEFILNIF